MVGCLFDVRLSELRSVGVGLECMQLLVISPWVTGVLPVVEMRQVDPDGHSPLQRVGDIT